MVFWSWKLLQVLIVKKALILPFQLICIIVCTSVLSLPNHYLQFLNRIIFLFPRFIFLEFCLDCNNAYLSSIPSFVFWCSLVFAVHFQFSWTFPRLIFFPSMIFIEFFRSSTTKIWRRSVYLAYNYPKLNINCPYFKLEWDKIFDSCR